jgi:hypothetical protein
MVNEGLIALVAFTALTAFAFYKWWQRRRVRRVQSWVKEYLSVQYGELPDHLNINCSDDRLWPVLVAFENPRTGSRQSLQFTCAGPESSFSLLWDGEENGCLQTKEQ